VIVDEIHAIADDKRGSHLALSLARLDASHRTQAAAHRAFGDGEADRRGGASSRPITRIVNIGHRREMDLAVEVPRDELGPGGEHEMWAEIYDRVAELILTHRTTLVFVNTRRLSERVTHALGGAAGPGTSCCRITAASREPCA
jgi:ATP-dependent Lhr-like helicase